MFKHSKVYFCGFMILIAFCNKSIAAVDTDEALPIMLDSRTGACTSSLPTSCAEAMVHGGALDGMYQLYLPGTGLKPFYVYCMKDPNKDGYPWTIIQRRQDGSIDFFRNWQEYKYGFGNLDGEFFLGLEYIHALTYSKLHELWIQMEDFENVTRFARYNSFIIGDENSKYALNALGSFNGNGGDSLIYHQGQKFSTPDQDNNGKNCPKQYLGAWWFKNCHRANLNGLYLGGAYAKEKFGQGIDWDTWHGHNYSLKYVHMAIRPVKR